MKIKKFNESNEILDLEGSDLLLKKLIKKFNDEKNLEKKFETAKEIVKYLGDMESGMIDGVDDEFVWQTFSTYVEHLGNFATAVVYTEEINDGIEMVDSGYLFDVDGFTPFEG